MDRSHWRTPLVVLVCGTAVMLVSFGIRATFGFYLEPVTGDLGWGRETFAFAIAFQNLMWGVSQPFAGALADRYGSGRVIAACAAIYGVGLYLMTQVTSPAELTLTAGLLAGIGMSGTGFGVILAVIGRSVPAERRSLYLGIGSAGGSAGQLAVVPMAQAFLVAHGWVFTVTLLAVLAFALVPLAAALTGRRGAGAEPEGEQTMGQALREAGAHPGYAYLTSGFFVCGFQVAFITVHLPAFIVDHGGAAWLGAVAIAIIGLANIIGTYTAGALGGRVSKKYLLSGLYFTRSIVIAIFVLVPVSDASILVFSGVIGLLWLSTVPLTSGLVAQIFGVRYMATLFGIVFLSHQLGSFAGVWMGGFVYDATGTYDLVWWFSVALGIVAAALHFPINEGPVPRLVAAR